MISSTLYFYDRKCDNLKKREKFTKQIEDVWSLPKDILSNAPIIRMYGGFNLSVENFRGILEYSDKLICLQCYEYKLYVRGKRLYIPYFGFKEILIKGYVEQISLQHESC